MNSIEDMIKGVSNLESKRYELEKQIIGEKIKCILEIAKAGEKIPYQLNLNKDELQLLEDILADKELEDNRGRRKK